VDDKPRRVEIAALQPTEITPRTVAETWIQVCNTVGRVNILFSVVSLAVLNGASVPSFAGSWSQSIARSSWSVTSGYAPHLGISEMPTLDFVRSLALLIERERGRPRGKWNGWMPTEWLRLKAVTVAGSHSGAELGSTALLWSSWISPTLTAEVGHYSGGDAFSRIRVLTQSPYLDPSLVRAQSFDYQAVYAGLELGTQSFAISFELGLTRAENAYQNIQPAEAAASNPVPPVQSARITQIGPAGKLALSIRLN
jgi:hypothetical protein